MKEQDYKKFYNVVVSACIDDILEYNEKSGFPPNSIIRREKKSKKIFKYYQEMRDYIRCNYMSKKIDVALDRHKVAACMMYAILKAKPLKVNRKIANLDEKILLANEYLALYAALNIVVMYKIDQYQLKEGEYEILFPETYFNDPSNDYVTNYCRTLYYISMENLNKFEVLAHANILFMLEKYTDISRGVTS